MFKTHDIFFILRYCNLFFFNDEIFKKGCVKKMLKNKEIVSKFVKIKVFGDKGSLRVLKNDKSLFRSQ